MEGRRDQRERLRTERQAVESGEAAALSRRRRVQYLSLAAFAAVAVIVALIVISQSGGGDNGGSSTPANVRGAAQVNAELQGIPQEGQTLGRADAAVTITEFGDPQCPACRAFAEQIAPQLISDQVKPGTANYVYEPYLIIGPDSKPAMKATLAAGEQGRFWNYLQLFYANQGQENSGYVTDEFLTKIAKAAGLGDLEAWSKSRNDPKWDAVLAKGASDAESFGFNGTPSILVKGPKGEKALSGFGLSEIEAAIQQVS